jgi:predicted TIM-barrel enzyme
MFRQGLEETGLGYGLEVDLIKAAHDLDLLTTPYAFTPAESAAMTKGGADIVVAHMGLTTSGSIGARTAKSLDDCVREVAAIADAAKGVRSEVFVLCHGGPIAMPADAQYVLDRVPACDGFYGASSMERLPAEVAITEQTRAFKGLRRSAKP